MVQVFYKRNYFLNFNMLTMIYS